MCIAHLYFVLLPPARTAEGEGERRRGREEGKPPACFVPAVTCSVTLGLLRDRRKSIMPRWLNRRRPVPLSFSTTPPLSPTQSRHPPPTSQHPTHPLIHIAFMLQRPGAIVELSRQDSAADNAGTHASTTPRWHRPSANSPADARWPARSRSARSSGY